MWLRLLITRLKRVHGRVQSRRAQSRRLLKSGGIWRTSWKSAALFDGEGEEDEDEC